MSGTTAPTIFYGKPCVLYNVTHEEIEETVCDIVQHTVSPLFSCVFFGILHFFLTVLKSKKGNFYEIYINLFITLERLI
jgi:hypothetical protein